MKILKYTLTILVLSAALNTQLAYAQSPTKSQALDEKLNTQINNLKDKIASRVSELNLVEKRGITGDVIETSNNQITLLDIQGSTRLIDIDEITKFSSTSTSENFGISDLKEGTKINILGLYNKESKRLLARFISLAVNPDFLSGSISDINEDDFTIKILSSNKKTSTIDVTTSTKTYELDQNYKSSRSGFSKLNIDDRIMAIGLLDKNDTNTIIADRILAFPTLSKNSDINKSEAPISPSKPQQ